MRINKSCKTLLFISVFIIILLTPILINLIINSQFTAKLGNNSDKPSNIYNLAPNDRDIYALENIGSVHESDDASSWNLQGGPPMGYDFVSTAAGKNHTYVLANDGTVWRHSNLTWNGPTWTQLAIAPPIISNGWVSIDISKDYIYILHADGDAYRTSKSAWPNGNWIQSSNDIPSSIPSPLFGGETSFVSIAVDWNNTFCFILRNNGEVYRHECDNSPIGGFWTNPGSIWDIYQSYYNMAIPPFKLEHGDGSGMYWNIPSTGWVSIDVYDNYLEPTNFSVYVLHNSGLVARHANHRFLAPFIDFWMNVNVPWELDPRWNPDWYGAVFQQSTAFVSIACNDLDIFILQNDAEVFFIPESAFLSPNPPQWMWGFSPLPLVQESKTSAFVSIDAWTEPFILKNDGKEWRNIPYRSAPNWDACWDNNQNNGQGTLYPNDFSYSSITAYTTNILFILSKNGSIYNSTDKGLNWQKFGDFGYGNDSSWVSIASANHKNHSYIYAVYNNGTVVRTTVGTFQPQKWGSCAGITGLPPDTSWVSIACDGNATVYTLNNFGFTGYKFQGGSWLAKGILVGDKSHQDSSWVALAAHHINMPIYALRNDRCIDASATGNLIGWGNYMPSLQYSSHVAITFNNKWEITLRNMGDIARGPYGTSNFNHFSTVIVPWNYGFVDITCPIDNYPWDNNPLDMVVSNVGTDFINWTLYDDIGLSHYRIIVGGTPQAWTGLFANASSILYPINKNRPGTFAYRIQYNDSVNQMSVDLVNVIVDFYPWTGPTSNVTTTYNDSTPIGWRLFDDVGGSHYRIWIENNPSNWSTWTNATLLQNPINRSNLGIFNYTIEFNDTRNRINTSTIFVTVRDPYIPWSNQPADIITFTNETKTINWTLYDGFKQGYYRVFINNTPSSWSPWLNNTNLQFPINKSRVGVFNYTIQYNDSAGNLGNLDLVWVTIRDITPPWSNSLADITTEIEGTETIDWRLYDAYKEGSYQVLKNGSNHDFGFWTNGTNLQININRSTLGLFNYTILYNDSELNFGIPNTVLVLVQDSTNPWVSPPSNFITSAEKNGSIHWTLVDNFEGSHYRVYVNNSPSNWYTWTNPESLSYPVNTTIETVLNYTIVYNDSANNWGSPSTVFVTIDLSPPIASNPNPLNSTIISDSTPNITVDLEDLISSINASSISLAINGSVKSHTWNGSTVNYTPSTPYNDGDYIIVSLNVSDIVDNKLINYNWNFYVDLAPPVASNPNPSNGNYTNNTRPMISIDLFDSLSGIDNSTILLNVGGSTVSHNWDGSKVMYTPSSDFSDAQVVSVSLDAKDNVGNTLPTYSWFFVVDVTKPFAVLPNPSNLSYSDNLPNISVYLMDATSGVDNSSIELRVEGILRNHTYNATSYLLSWVPLTPFSDGEVIDVELEGKDRAGNRMDTYKWSFTVDGSPPIITNPIPSNNSYTNNNLTSILVNITDNVSGVNTSSIILYINQSKYNLSSPELSWSVQTLNFTPSTEFDNGVLNITLNVKDNVRNAITPYNWFFIVDTVIPKVDIISPTPIIYPTTNIWLNLTCNDINWNSTWYRIYNVSDSTWWTSINITWTNNVLLPFDDNKTYQIYVWGNDSAGNTQSNNNSVQFSVDTSIPRILIVSPVNQSYGFTNIHITVDNSSSISPIDQIWFRYSINSAPMTNNYSLYWNTSYWVNETTIFSEGSIQLIVYANNSAGTISKNETWFTVDSTPPTINISTPTEGSTLFNDTYFYVVDLGSNDSDIEVIIMQYDNSGSWNNYATWISGFNLTWNVSGNNIFQINTSSLTDGITYKFRCIALDEVPNIGISTIGSIKSLKIDNTPPTWVKKVSNLLFEVEDTSQYLYWEASDILPGNYTIYSQNGSILNNNSWILNTNITYNLGQLSIGNRSYRIVINDSVGHQIEDTVWVCVQNNTIKTGIPYNLNIPNIYNGINISIGSDLPGNLTVSEQSDPSGGAVPDEYTNTSTIFVDISFETDYSGSNRLTVDITIYLDQQKIEDNNIDPETITIAYWDQENNTWVLLETQFNYETYAISVNIDHLTYFAIFGKIKSGGVTEFPWHIIIIVAVIGAVVAALAIFLNSRRSKGKPQEIKPKKKGKKGSVEKLILKRDDLIDKAEAAIDKGEIKEAIRYFEQIGKISRELGEYELYNQCVEKVKELRASLLKTIGAKPEEAPPSEIPIPIAEEKEIQVLRGGEVVGDKIIYKVKIQNNSQYNITDVTVFLISYPRECMGLTTKETRSTPKVESSGYRSLEFEFEPHKDCVEGTVHASVTYIDHLNQSHTESVNPFTIRSVCDLLKPYRVKEEEFDKMVLAWQKTGEFKKVNLNIYNLFERSKITLERHNFSIVSSKLYETEDSILVRGLIKAFAEGKYGKKKIGMLVEMMGSKDGELAQIRTSSTSEDEGMMASPISEVIEDFSQAGLSLDNMSPQEQEEFIKEKSLQSLRYLLVLHKEAGITVYSVNFSEQALDADLVSGFLSAISSFGVELSGGQSIGIRKMEYESLKIVLQQGNYVNVGLILDDFPENWLDLRLKTFVKALETQYKENFENWTGDMRPFRTIGQLFAKIFEIQE